MFCRFLFWSGSPPAWRLCECASDSIFYTHPSEQGAAVALRFILILLVAASGLLLLFPHLGPRQSNDMTGSVGELSNARSKCIERYGTEKDQSRQLSACNSKCLEDAVGDAAQECVVNCRKRAEAFGNCLVEQITPAPGQSSKR